MASKETQTIQAISYQVLDVGPYLVGDCYRPSCLHSLGVSVWRAFFDDLDVAAWFCDLERRLWMDHANRDTEVDAKSLMMCRFNRLWNRAG
jgi:hypothetical protein